MCWVFKVMVKTMNMTYLLLMCKIDLEPGKKLFFSRLYAISICFFKKTGLLLHITDVPKYYDLKFILWCVFDPPNRCKLVDSLLDLATLILCSPFFATFEATNSNPNLLGIWFPTIWPSHKLSNVCCDAICNPIYVSDLSRVHRRIMNMTYLLLMWKISS